MAFQLVDVVFILFSAAFLAFWWRRLFRPTRSKPELPLPPGPRGWPLVGNLLQIIADGRHFIFVVRELRRRYGPIFTLRMGQRTLLVVTSADLMHEALVRRGALFASRPADSPTRLLFSCGKRTINASHYGPLWRSLRRNFVAEVVAPARVKNFAWIRDWAVAGHLERLRREFGASGAVNVMSSCRLAICGILICICFGAKVTEKRLREIEEVLKEVMLMSLPKLPDFLPALTPLFQKQLGAARTLRRRQLDCLVPLVRARARFLNGKAGDEEVEGVEMVSPAGEAYIDSLFDLELESPGRWPTEEELVTLCSEVISAGTDTSATTLEWAMMRLILHPAAQERLRREVVAVAGREGRIGEAEVEAMPYLQAIVKETLRRHPPSHFVLSHAATKDTELGGYRIPANASVEFYTAWLTEDPETWTDPDAWLPERFLKGGEGYDTDLTCTRHVRMMPFGAGRRICPAGNLGVLHVQLMLAATVREFRLVPVPGERPPSPTETFAFTVVMKEPLRVAIQATTEEEMKIDGRE